MFKRQAKRKKGRTWFLRLEFKSADLWVGLYWKDSTYQIDVWVCLVPCLPIHFCYVWGTWMMSRRRKKLARRYDADRRAELVCEITVEQQEGDKG